MAVAGFGHFAGFVYHYTVLGFEYYKTLTHFTT